MRRYKPKHRFIRAGRFDVETILSKVFTNQVCKELKREGFGTHSKKFMAAARKRFLININGKPTTTEVKMGSQRYQLFVAKGTTCKRCGLKGSYFCLEKHSATTSNKFHFNLYGIDKDGTEVMLTKDHIVPKSKGGPNRLDNYQTLCERCNARKGDGN
jgi:5-methylcytosine-specific restriction endonuclease McrA